ncbi:MAG: TolC family protein [Anaerotignum sp.]|nr:TolC family protein [Anaerotignum sp.]
MKKCILKKGISLFLCTVMLTGTMIAAQPVQAAQYTLLLSHAKTIALANSDSYRQIKSKISLKEVSYKQAVKSIQLKIKNKTTFRWSPLLSFKFPEKLNFEDESSMVYKPAQIQNDITSLKHDLTDEVFRVYESTEQAYVKAYTLQEKVAFEEEQLEGLQNTLAKNKGRLILGLATQADVDAMEKNVTAAEEKLAADMKSFENAKTKLGDLLHMDVTTRYTLVNPYIDAEIPRTKLDDLVQYTLDHDQAYYEAKMATALSMIQLETNYNLIKSQYGSKAGRISPYVQTVMSGGKVDSSAFKTSYDKFLTDIDKPWAGHWRILFIKIPKEWIKGQIDGVRYVEDEPYALYENALEYQDVLTEQQTMAKELETQVRDTFESVVTARSAYLKLKTQVAEAKEQLQKELVLNQLGELTFEEYTESQKQYEEQQVEMLEALETYTSLLYSFDRLTCGAVSKYFKDQGIDLSGSEGGNSYIVDEEIIDGARYYITSIVEDNMFEFGVYLPEDFETEVTHYELWVDDYIIGEKKEVEQTLRHLTLTLTGKERVFVRLYNDEEFVDDCEIDATAYQGPLNITGYTVTKTEEALKREIGSYEMRSLNDMGLVEITLTIDGVEDVHYYAIQNEAGTNLLTPDAKVITDTFVYLDFLSKDMDFLQIQCYDAGKGEKYVAYFNTLNQTIYTIDEE